MDQSDRIRALQSQTVFTYYRVNALSTQPTCNFSSCTSSFTGCVVNYPSFAEKEQVRAGSKVCNNCSTAACGC